MNCLMWVLGTQISLNPQVTSLFLVYLFFLITFYLLFVYVFMSAVHACEAQQRAASGLHYFCLLL